jgi:hypothetical protein
VLEFQWKYLVSEHKEKFGERKSIAGENSECFHGSRENFEESLDSLFTVWEGEEP